MNFVQTLVRYPTLKVSNILNSSFINISVIKLTITGNSTLTLN